MRVSVVVSLFAIASSLLAQSPPATTPVIHDQLVVTATLEPESSDRLPVAVEVLQAEEIERRSTGDALDLLRTVPGLAVVQSGSPGKQASLFTRGAASSQTVVVWNGVELNDPAFGGFDWSLLSTDGLERIEVVRGPFSAIWGSAAMGGVVQLVTGRGGARHAALRLEGGTHGAGRASGSAGARLGAVALDLAGHLRTGDGELDNDGYDGGELDLRAEFEPTEASRIGLLLRANDAEIGLPYDFFSQPAPERRQQFDSTTVALPASWQGERWGVDGALSRLESETELSDPNDPFAAATNEARRDKLRAVGRRTFTDLGWVAFGGEAQEESATTASAFGPGLDDERAGSRALFVQAGLGRGRWSAELGLRRDDHDAFGGATSARGGVVFRAHERLLLRASAGESFRAPSLGDLYFPGFANPELQPERGESVELGLEAKLGALRFSLAGYDNEFRDLIQFDFATFAPENVGRARARGVEASLGARWSAFELSAGATWLDTEDRATGEPLPRRPERSAHLVALWTHDRVGVHGSLVAVGPREDVGEIALASYEVVDLGASFAWTERIEPFVRIENAFDRAYEEAAGFPAPGRAWTVGLALRGRP